MHLCDGCKDSKIPGVLICEFDDRGPNVDGRVFIAACDECDRFEDGDAEAADEVSRVTGWSVMKSFDHIDNPDSDSRDDPKFKTYWRPYFSAAVADAEAAIYGHPVAVKSDKKDYIGDGVYVDHEYGQIVLTTEDGVSVTNRIVLEGDVVERLMKWMRRLGMKP